MSAALASVILIVLIAFAAVDRAGRAGARPRSPRLYNAAAAVMAAATAAVVAMSAAGELIPNQAGLSDYQQRAAEEYLEEGLYLQQDALDDYGGSVRDTLYWTSATGEEYAPYWEMIAAAETLRDGLFWKQHAQADPADSRSAGYWRAAQDALARMEQQAATEENRQAIAGMCRQLA